MGVVACTAACGTPPAPDRGVQVLGLPSPAGPGSGQPSVETTDEGVLLAWTEASGEGLHRLRTSHLGPDGWTTPRTIVERDSLFVNWADFSLVRRAGDGVLAAHWLVRYPRGGAAYRIEAAFSRDGGRTWSDPWIPHEDGTVSEHGFVSWMTLPDGGTGLVWLDGRAYAAAEGGHGAQGHGAGGGQMSLRFRSIGPDGTPSPEEVLDPRTCDCCQTAAAETASGPIVAYRGRSEGEIRDIEVVRWEAGRWTEPRVVHADGWEIHGCPVNGPALAARGSDVALAWFTAAGDAPRVKVAFSGDGGRTFGPPVVADDGRPEGRVDLRMTAPGRVWLAWLERTADGADVRIRRIAPDGTLRPSITVAASSESRASGFPRMAPHPDGGLVLAWTDPSEPSAVKVARIVEPTP